VTSPPATAPVPSRRSGPTGGVRQFAAAALVVAAAVVAVLALLAGFVRYQAFDKRTFKTTSAKLIADTQLRNQIGAALVDQLYGNVDVAVALRKDLPPDQKRLAGPLAAALRELSGRAAIQLLGRPRVEALWVDSASAAQRQLLKLLENRGAALHTQGGSVVLDLRPLVVQLAKQIGVNDRVAKRLPGKGVQIQIMQADQLETAQKVTRILKTVGSILWLVPLALIALAIWLGRGRRRTILRRSVIGAAFAGLLVLVTRTLAGVYVTNHLVASESARPAARDAWNIATQLLADGAWTTIAVMAIAAAGLWLTGDGNAPTAARRAMANPLARPEIAFGSVGLFMTLVVWWGPTPQTRRWYLVLTVALLLAAGVELLRRQSTREAHVLPPPPGVSN
jgi:hypothetical protein